jgi:hypothetical protein
VARVPLPEEKARNHITSVRLKRRKDCHEAWKATEISKRNQNDARAQRRRFGAEDVSSDEDCEPRLDPLMMTMKKKKRLWPPSAWQGK